MANILQHIRQCGCSLPAVAASVSASAVQIKVE